MKIGKSVKNLQYSWIFLIIPIISPIFWFKWDTSFYIFGGDSINWLGFSNIIETYFPYLWNEFDGAGHPFANNPAIPTALFFWSLETIGLPKLLTQMIFFVTLSALSAMGIYRIGKLYFIKSNLQIFVIVSSIIYLLNIFGFDGENRRIFTNEFTVTYYLLPLFLSYILTAIENQNTEIREALLASLTSIFIHNFNIIPALSTIGFTYILISLYYIIFVKDKRFAIYKFNLIFFSVANLLIAYQLFAIYQYYQVTSFAENINTIVPEKKVSTADLLIKIFSLTTGIPFQNLYFFNIIYLLPLILAIYSCLCSTPKKLVSILLVLLVGTIFIMDAGGIATDLLNLNESTAFLYSLFRFPHIKFTAPFLLSISLLCGMLMARYADKKIIVISLTLTYSLLLNPKAFTEWLPIQLEKPIGWINLSKILEEDLNKYSESRIIKIPSVEYFKDGVGGVEFKRANITENSESWMIHSTTLGLVIQRPIFSLDMTIGAKNNNCLKRIMREDLGKDEIIWLLNFLGIDEVLLSKKFKFQRQYTPLEKIIKSNNLVTIFENDIPYKKIIYENEDVKLSLLNNKNNKYSNIFIGKELKQVSEEDFNDCNFYEIQKNSLENTVFIKNKKSNDFLDKILINKLSYPEITYTKKSNSEYYISLRNISKDDPFIILLNNTYADWIINYSDNLFKYDNFRDLRFKANSFATAWLLDYNSLCKNNLCRINSNNLYDVDIVISYFPQIIYNFLISLSIISILIILLYLFYIYFFRILANNINDRGKSDI